MMKLYEDFDIDYEQMDDLPLSEHIDWQQEVYDEEMSTEMVEDKSQMLLDIDIEKFQDPNSVLDELTEHIRLDPNSNLT